MRHLLTNQLMELFEQSPKGAWDVTGVNVALHRIMHAPYFRGNYDTFDLTQQGPELYSLTFHPPQSTQFEIYDPLMGSYDYWYETDDDDFETPPIVRDRLVFHRANDLPEQALLQAQSYLDRLPQDLIQTVFHPKEEDFQRKDRLMLSVMDAEGLRAFGQDLLGGTHNPTFQDEGIKYHRPEWCRNEEWMFVVAHNEHEVAGILGGYADERVSSWALSYVSVSPQFRNQGVSKRMYQKMIDHCVHRELILVRSNASDFTQERGITRKYETLLQQAPLLHCVTGTYTENALQRARDVLSYKELVDLNLSSVLNSRQDGDWEHAEHIKKVVARCARHAPQRRPSLDR